MRHHRGSHDADGDVEHQGVGDDFAAGNEAAGDGAPIGRGQHQLDREADGDHDQEREHERFDQPQAPALEHQDQ